MTTIIFRKNKRDEYLGFTVTGHTGFADSGNDIVCAAISILTINTINAMELLAGEQMSVVTNEEEGLIDCRFQGLIHDKSKVLMDSLVLGITSIAEQYGSKHCKFTFEEV